MAVQSEKCRGASCQVKILVESRICVVLMEVEAIVNRHPAPDQHQKINKCVSKMHINKRRGAVKTMRNTPPPFQRKHFGRSLHASIYSTRGIENGVYTRRK